MNNLPIKISDHAAQRFAERKIPNDELLMFLKFCKEHMCEMVFDCVKDGNVDGYSRRYKFGSTFFAITFDTNIQQLVLKTLHRKEAK